MGQEERVVKKGTKDWWTAIALMEAAENIRKRDNLPKDAAVTMGMDDINKVIDKYNRNIFKRLWLLLTNGDIKERTFEGKIGGEIILKK